MALSADRNLELRHGTIEAEGSILLGGNSNFVGQDLFIDGLESYVVLFEGQHSGNFGLYSSRLTRCDQAAWLTGGLGNTVIDDCQLTTIRNGR